MTNSKIPTFAPRFHHHSASGLSVRRSFVQVCLRFVLLFTLGGLASPIQGEEMESWVASEDEPIDLTLFIDGIEHWAIFSPVRDYERIPPSDIQGIAQQLLKFQNPDGGWPKNIDWLGKLEPEFLKVQMPDHRWESSFDNRNTYSQIRFLARANELSPEPLYREAVLRGLHFILESQHESGGWRGSDVDAITFNDEVMTGIMHLLNDIVQGDSSFAFLETELRDRLESALQRAIEVTLKCQVRQGERLTAWGQQHDHETLQPVAARSYELAALAAWESAKVVEFLMTLPEPSQEVRQSVIAAVQWFRKSAILGHAYLSIPAPPRPYHQTTVDFDRIFFENETAPPVWARFYSLADGKPFLTRRDGTVVNALHELSYERRIGYDWYGYWPNDALKRYPKWLQESLGAQSSSTFPGG